MASSSVSQDDVDANYEVASRRYRIRTTRSRNVNSSTARTGEVEEEDGGDYTPAVHSSSAAMNATTITSTWSGLHPGITNRDHDVSPKPVNRIKDKRASRCANINKAKQQRDRRKLREKRRSTGVVHVPSTESTGGSTGEDEELLSLAGDTRRTTSAQYCDGGGVDQSGVAAPAQFNNRPHQNDSYISSDAVINVSTQQEYPKHNKKFYSKPRNKSPSDLEADDEDNQDYDSLTMSDSTLSLTQVNAAIIPVSASKVPPTQARCLPHSNSKYELLKHHHHQMQQQQQQPTHHHPALLRGTTYCSGVCSRGGYMLNNSTVVTPSTVASSTTQHQHHQLLTANRPNNGRPATPSSESSEELLERAREENRRLLALLAEREQRIAALEGRLALTNNTSRSFEGAVSSATALSSSGKAPEEEAPISSSNTSGSSSSNISSNSMSVGGGGESAAGDGSLLTAMKSLSTEQ